MKGLYLSSVDHSAIIIEWLEIQRAQGIDKVCIYILTVHPNILRVLSYYKKIAFVEMIKITIPYENIVSDNHTEYVMDIHTEHCTNQVLQNHDCFYRFKSYSYHISKLL